MSAAEPSQLAGLSTSPLLGLALLASGCSAVATGDPIVVRTDGIVDTAPAARVVYTGDRSLSPITPEIAARLHAVISAGPGRTEVVAKIGDSITVAREYLGCFASPNRVELAGRERLRPTIEWFTASIAGASSWSRKSAAAGGGWAAFRALYGAPGDPSPIDRELDVARPAFATVMFGTNDIELASIERYGRNLLDITDLLLARGVVPILSTIPPRGDDRAADAWVGPYNAVVRAIAQARQVPLIDLHRELAAIRSHGLTGDHIHLSSNITGCRFTPSGLAYGTNRRNLMTLEMLDQLRRAVLAGEPAADPDPPRLAGAGTPGDPFVIPSLPFGDGGDTRGVTTRAIDRYTCGHKRSDATGAEIYYRLDVATATVLRAYVIDRAGADHRLHVVRDPADPTTCVARGGVGVSTRLVPGTYYLVVDTAGERPGEYLLAVTGD